MAQEICTWANPRFGMQCIPLPVPSFQLAKDTLRAHAGGEMPPRPQAASDIYQLVMSAERPMLNLLGNMHKVTTFIKNGGYPCAIRRAIRHKFGSSF